MSGGFKRSSTYGIAGLVVVMALCAAIGIALGQGESPKLALGLIFGVLGAYLVGLFSLQRADLDRAASGEVDAAIRAAADGGRSLPNPATMGEAQLWGAMAIAPIDDGALRARTQLWDAGRGSLRLGVLITALIFLTVPPMYLLESFVPVLIGAPLIAIAAIYGSLRAIAPGGTMDSGYERVDRAMAPLGLGVTERPRVSIEARDAAAPRVGPRIRGAVELRGERLGRPVTVRLGREERSGASQVAVGAAVPEFEARSRDGRVRPGDGAPPAIAEALQAVPSSTRWKRVKVRGGEGGIVVERRGGAQGDWLCDLWLAERLAEA